MKNLSFIKNSIDGWQNSLNRIIRVYDPDYNNLIKYQYHFIIINLFPFSRGH